VTEIMEVLLDNAHRHGAGAVTVTTRRLNGWVAVEVADEGPGLGDDPERAFARRSGEVRAGGHGIGLVLARSLAQAEGGSLTARAGPAPVLTLMLRGRAPGGEDGSQDAVRP
jgi:signal transduction histidine kinase